jgi:hypothetical protein
VANRLINTGAGTESAPPIQETNMATAKKESAAKAEPNETRRAFRYSSDCPAGKIFTGDTAIAAAEKDGWKDCPPSAAGDEAEDAGK